MQEDKNVNQDKNTNDKKNAKTDDAATVSMQGVSGKVIKGKVKVKKMQDQKDDKKQDKPAKTAPSQKSAKKKSSKEIVRPRKIGSIQERRAKKEKAEAEAKAKAQAQKEAEAKKKQAAAKKEEPDKKKTKTTKAKKKKKPASLKDKLSRPRKIKSGKEVAEEEARKEKARKEAEQAKKAKQASKKSKKKPKKKVIKPISSKGPRKLASGDSGELSDKTDESLAETVKVYAEEQAKKEQAKKERKKEKRRKKEQAKAASFNPYASSDQDGSDNGNRRSKRTRARNFEYDRKYDKQRERERQFAKKEKNRRAAKKKEQPVMTDSSPVSHVALPETMTVKEFAESISRTATDVIMHLMQNGVMASVNDNIDFDTATIIADEFDVTTEKLDKEEEEIATDLFDESEDDDENLVPRPPVVTVMGHVDHGKTTLLDYIRKSDIADDEQGGITQSIGAYQVELNDRKITFIDTPGHEAFTTMRARGAQATDIVILVVAADDGVMPQTVEAIDHAKAAGTEIIVAINKIDRPNANPERIKEQLTAYDLVAEEWGGDTIMVPISAKTGENVDELLEMVLLTADIMELKADPEKQAKGIIIEARLDKNRGALATALVQRGTLKVGDTIIVDTVVGNVRSMTNAKHEQVKEAGPSTPVEILGLPEVAEAGSTFYVVEDEKKARQWAEERAEAEREKNIGNTDVVTLDNLFSKIEEGKITEFNVIIKADNVGSVEALEKSLEELSNDEIRVNVIHGVAGAVNESDVRLAEASDAIIIGFNVKPSSSVKDLADELNVEIRLYSIIYRAIEDVQDALEGQLEPEYEEVTIGHAEIRELYHFSQVGTIGGAYVQDGVMRRNADCRVIRDGIVVKEDKIASLQRYQDSVTEVSEGYECGLTLADYNQLKEGDIIETFEMQEVKR